MCRGDLAQISFCGNCEKAFKQQKQRFFKDKGYKMLRVLLNIFFIVEKDIIDNY